MSLSEFQAELLINFDSQEPRSYQDIKPLLENKVSDPYAYETLKYLREKGFIKVVDCEGEGHGNKKYYILCTEDNEDNDEQYPLKKPNYLRAEEPWKVWCP